MFMLYSTSVWVDFELKKENFNSKKGVGVFLKMGLFSGGPLSMLIFTQKKKSIPQN